VRREQTAFGSLLSLALVLPGLVALSAWCLLWLVEFPPRTAGACGTAIAIFGGTLGELASVCLAITQLIRKPALRTDRNTLLTAFGTAVLFPDLCVMAVLIAGW
jgi:hypothetical protein